MTPTELQEARKRLRMSAADLGRALQLSGRDPGRNILIWEAGKARIPGPVQVALRLMLDARKAARDALRITDTTQPATARPEAPQAAREPIQPIHDTHAYVERLRQQETQQPQPFTRRRSPR